MGMKDAHRNPPRAATWLFRLAGCTALTALACTGEVLRPAGTDLDSAGRSPGSGIAGSDPAVVDPGGPLSPDEPSEADPNVAGARPLRRLTELELNNSVRSLLRDPGLAWQDLGGDPHGEHGFSEPAVSVPAERLYDIAEELSQGADLAGLYKCTPASEGEPTCAARFISTVGARAYRRPVEADEQAALLELYTKVRAGGFDFNGGLRMTMQAMLLSPNFLYHWQLGAASAKKDGAVVALKDYELASRLSYFLWSDMPDDALLEAANKGELTKDGLSTQVERMLADPRSKNTVQTFHSQWLELEGFMGVSKDATMFPEWNDDLKRSMVQETKAFVADVFSKDTVPLETLFSAPYTFVNESLAKIYGINGIKGTELQRVTLDATQRGGLLTQLSVIATQANPATTNPPRAGKMVFTEVLCQEIADPPAGATESFKTMAELSTRDNFARLEALDTCKGCHKNINPPGFAFEQYDAIGRVRTMEGPHRVDSSGTFKSRAGDLPFTNLASLGAALSTTPELRECVARKWLQFALGRKATTADRYSLDEAFKAFHETNYDVKKLLKAIAMSRTFRYRAPEAGEVM